MTAVRTSPPNVPAGTGIPQDAGTRTRILRAAAALFHDRGFERSSMKQIAAVAGIQKSSLYHHFPGKQELLFEILSHTVDLATGRLQAIVTSDRPAAERLAMAVRNHVINLVNDLDNVACFVEEGKALAAPYRAAYIAKRDAYERGFRQIVADGMARGEFRRLDVRLAGFAVLGMCNWMVRWYHPGGGMPAEEIASMLGALAVRSLAARAPEDAARPGQGKMV